MVAARRQQNDDLSNGDKVWRRRRMENGFAYKTLVSVWGVDMTSCRRRRPSAGPRIAVPASSVSWQVPVL